jgi:hypothetical protein
MFGRERKGSPTFRDPGAIDDFESGSDAVDGPVELEIVGESYRQETLAEIAGPKDWEGKWHHVGVTLRCDPRNEYDQNAVRVEVMGQLVGYVARSTAEHLSPAVQRLAGGALEANGLIVGGWKRPGDEGHFGIRVWISSRDAERIQVQPEMLDVNRRGRWPQMPPEDPAERRLSPKRSDFEAGRSGSTVTVTFEEHYQPAIGLSMPAGWDPDETWPLLVDLLLSPANPHCGSSVECIEVQFQGMTVGYLTPKMTARHRGIISACCEEGKRATARATASRGTKRGEKLWRVKVLLATEAPH